MNDTEWEHKLRMYQYINLLFLRDLAKTERPKPFALQDIHTA